MGPTRARYPITVTARDGELDAHRRQRVCLAGARPYITMMTATDPRSFLYRDSLDPEAAKALTAEALGKADDGELYLQYRKSESFGFDDGLLKTASYDTHSGFGLRAVSGEMTAFAHASELSEAAIKRAAETDDFKNFAVYDDLIAKAARDGLEPGAESKSAASLGARAAARIGVAAACGERTGAASDVHGVQR